MSRKFVSLIMVALVVFASTAFVLPTASAQAGGGHNGALILPVSGTATPGTGAAGNLTNAASVVGNLAITSFQVVNGALQAVGTLTVNILDAAGNVLQTLTVANFALPITSTTQQACPILHLDVGPLNLNLLGLQISLNQVVLNITAQPGPGNLLGNLLCSVANLLNNGGPLSQIASLLNQILGAL